MLFFLLKERREAIPGTSESFRRFLYYKPPSGSEVAPVTPLELSRLVFSGASSSLSTNEMRVLHSYQGLL